MEKSPSYFYKHWRNTPQERIEVLEEFLAWYEEEITNPYADKDAEKLEQAQIKAMRGLIDKFLEHDPKKVKQGEKEMLERWIKANGKDSLPK